MPKNHLKTQKAPRTWPIKRKNTKFISRPNPSAHSLELSLPLVIVLRDLLKKAKTNKEVKNILHNQDIFVNGKNRNNNKFSMGLMDVLSIKKENEHYIMLINSQNKLYLHPISKKSSLQKTSKIKDKKIGKNGIIQLNTLDGRTILIKKSDGKPGDSVVLSIPSQELLRTLKLEKGAKVLLFKGKHVGKIVLLESVRNGIIIFKHNSKKFETKKDCAMVVDESLLK
ncbi:30S ribosomal protein S4e [Candidatus Woesearchaeota archaeon]|jgi:small subunit ribosomal protein S4e|nr:30S ribosomal protein S4e [Candidatus Woesearchaeota archaeon]|tara:strand:+ start:514 stop:1191 length:678 start_codon:yes stop_codon:yes gene_type:complete